MEILAIILLTVSAAILFATEALRVDVVAMLVMLALAISGLVSPEQSLSGFSNPATATVAAMFILSAALKHTGVIDGLAAALGAVVVRRPGLLYPLLIILVAAVSAFINNTAAVAVFIPLVLGLSRTHGASPGRLLMPLSFAAQVGGVCTLIGTSTNILVSNIAAGSGERPFDMFEFSSLGLNFVFAAFLYLFLVAPFLLKDRVAAPASPLTERYQLHHYLAEVELEDDSPLAGKSLAQADLEKRMDIEVLEILREGRPLWLPGPEETLAPGDLLLVRGPIHELLKTRNLPGLKMKRDLAGERASIEGGDVVLMEAVVPTGSPLDGRTLEEHQFRRRHRSQVLAIRHHDRLERRKVGKVRLDVGDVLLLQGHRADLDALRNGTELILMEEVLPHGPSWRRAAIAISIIAAVVTAAAVGLVPILIAAMAGCAALIVTRIISVEQAYRAIDWKVIFLLAGVIPLGIALDQTGAADLLARGVTNLLGGYGPWVILSAFYVLTSLLTQLMSNNATAALLAPLAFATAAGMGVSVRPLLVAITFAASTSFLTPVGYQTNAMVMGPGRYRVSDFTRVGLPLTIIFWILATVLIPRYFPFY
jgi:di/tricarboxylate transporter